MTTTLQTNEIRDYLARAPKRWTFNGGRMVNHTFARLSWLADISRGTLDARINRRAGILDEWKPWHSPVASSMRRHHRRALRREGCS